MTKKTTAFKKLCKKYDVDAEVVPEIISFEAACVITGDNPKDLPIVEHLPEHRRKPIIANHMLDIIVQALNEGKRPDYTNTDEWKWFPYFTVNADKKRPSGFGLSCLVYVTWIAYSVVGSRRCFIKRDTAIFCAKHFTKLYEEVFLFD